MSGIQGIVKIVELRKRILFTLAVLVVYRFGVHVPIPGADGEALKQFFITNSNTIFGMFNMFSGGALERASVLALGVSPYISASIIFQLLTVVVPKLGELQKEGDQGRKKITQYTRYATFGLALVQGYALAGGMAAMGVQNGMPVVPHPGQSFQLLAALTLATGTVFVMWLGEQISERGIGNGISLLIFAGIAASIPSGVAQALSLYRSNELTLMKLALIAAIIVAVFYGIIFVERGSRRVPVQYAKRVVGRKVYGGQNTHIPLKVNTAGVIPPIFASSLIMFPATFATFFPNSTFLQNLTSQLTPGALLYEILFVGLIVFFAYFYTAIQFKTDDVSENLKKYGGFIPGIRPGQPTADYLDHVLSRLTLGGAIYIAAVCVLPVLFTQSMKVPFYFGGTSVLILVGVALDTVAQIETFLLQSNYEGFMKNTRIRGRQAVQT
jgi:preprotein translocase subunit SecY